jgi:hypothetical protein
MGLHADAVPTVVVSDFGRDAALRFCAAMAQQELEAVSTQLPEGAAFRDEYRRIALHVVGDLGFIKAPWLAPYRAESRPFDDRVLVGFPGGPPKEDVVCRIGVLVIEALAGPAKRGCDRAIVALPCNTLAPVSWALRHAFSSRDRLLALVDDARYEPVGLETVAKRMTRGRVEFPTVPQAVLWQCARVGADVVLPLGTPGIVEVYERSAVERGVPVNVVSPEPGWQDDVLEAIQASIAADPIRRERSRRALLALQDTAKKQWGQGTAIIEACTDLDYGVGMDSGKTFAGFVVDRAYTDEGIA